MRKSSKPAIFLVPAAAIALSVVTNVAANSLPPNFRPAPLLVWAVLAILAIIVVAAQVHSSRRSTESETAAAAVDEDALRTASAALAHAVRDQWRGEAAVRALNQPDPIKVRWSTTTRSITPSPSSILGDRAVPGRILRLHLGGDLTQIAELFRRLPRHQLVILGNPGAGKSVMALLLTLKILATRNADNPVPVLLSLSSWNPRREHLLSWIIRRITEDYPGLTNTELYGNAAPQRLVSEGKIIPILDGLDEIPEALRGESIFGINQAFGQTQPFVITCRFEEYECAVETTGHVLGSAAVVEILPIDAEQIISYLSSLGPANEIRWSQVFARLRVDPSGSIAVALSTPLFIWLARMAYSDLASRPSELLNDQLFASHEAIEEYLLDKFVPAVYSDWPPGPGDRERMRVAPEDAERWLRFLAKSLFRESAFAKPGLTVRDQTDIAWWRIYQAVRPMELGFAAFLIAGPMMAAPLVLALQISALLTVRRTIAFGTILAVVVLAGLTLAASLSPPPPGRIQIRLPRRGQIPGNLRVGLLYGCLAAFTAAVAAGLGALELKGHQKALYFGFWCGFVAGAVTFVVAVFNGPVDTVRASNPELILKGDRAVAIAAAVLTGPSVFLAAWILTGSIAESVGGAVSASIGVSLAMSSWGWFFVATIWLGLRRRLPFRLIKFLFDAYNRGVLRRAGAVYQFRHARLQDRLANESHIYGADQRSGA